MRLIFLAKTGDHIVSVDEAVAAFGVWGPVNDEDRSALETIVRNVTEFSNSHGQPYSLDVFKPDELERIHKRARP